MTIDYKPKNFEPKPGKLYLPLFEYRASEPQLFLHKTVYKPRLDFIDPETGMILIKTQSDFVNTPLLFLKTKRHVETRKGHGHIQHQDDHGLACFGNEANIGSLNHWDESQHKSADISYAYHFLYKDQIVAVLIPADRSFGEFFREAT